MLGVLAVRVTAVVATVAAIVAVAATPASAASRPAAPSHGSLRLYVPDAFVVGRQLVTVPGRTIHVRGVVRPYVAGQTVLVKALVGSRQFKSDRLRILPAAGGRY